VASKHGELKAYDVIVLAGEGNSDETKAFLFVNLASGLVVVVWGALGANSKRTFERVQKSIISTYGDP
jgi:hypothetical protein